MDELRRPFGPAVGARASRVHIPLGLRPSGSLARTLTKRFRTSMVRDFLNLTCDLVLISVREW